LSYFYTVSRRGNINEDDLLTGIKNIEKPIWTVENIYNKNDVKSYISSNYSELSMHGLKYLIERINFPKLDNSNYAPYDWVIEFVFEMVREKHYKELPSRFMSIFGCDDIESARLFRKNHGIKNNAIYKVEAHNFLKADMNLLKLGPSMVGSVQFAKNYWEGKSSGSPFWEYLLQFPVKVIELIKE